MAEYDDNDNSSTTVPRKPFIKDEEKEYNTNHYYNQIEFAETLDDIREIQRSLDLLRLDDTKKKYSFIQGESKKITMALDQKREEINKKKCQSQEDRFRNELSRAKNLQEIKKVDRSVFISALNPSDKLELQRESRDKLDKLRNPKRKEA